MNRKPENLGPGQPRTCWPERNQVTLRCCDLDGLLPPDHQARVVWAFVERQDLSLLRQRIKATADRQGHPAIDPALLLALWLYATLDGVGSARELDRLCREHLAYQWLCGGVGVNYHTLADFRSQQEEFLDQLLTRNVAALLESGLVEMQRVAQDGVRVRAAAGASSFRRRDTLQRHLAEAEEQVRRLKELARDPEAGGRRRAAQERAARERAERIGQALAQLPQVEAKQKSRKKGQPKPEARCSTTDPEARVMKMADGGFRPAYNGQLATDTASQIIVGVELINSGGDQGQLLPMVEQVGRRYEQLPAEWLVDGGFAKKKDIETVSAAPYGVTVYAPEPTKRNRKNQPGEAVEGDGPAVKDWRRRMQTVAAKGLYKERAATAECVNAQARNRGLQRFLVRGLRKARAVLLLFALAHNLWRAHVLTRERVLAPTG
jgi:transposase